jgi:GntR family transcriptional regulator/MocR family aminotransferase
VLIPLEGGAPLYRQIYRALRRAILEGDLVAGARLPSTRGLARELGVSRNVVLLAFEQLAAEGFVTMRVGAGTYVATALPEGAPVGRSAPTEAAAPVSLSPYGARALAERRDVVDHPEPPPYDFRYGHPDVEAALLRRWKRHLARQVFAASTDYGAPDGDPRLQRAVASYLRRERGVRCEPERILITSGSQQALDLAARTLLTPGERVVIEEPHYQGARQLFAAAGAELVPVPVDDEGLDPERLPAQGARLAYLTPSHQFPTGAVMPLSRRLALLAWAERTGAYVLEDDYDSEYRYGGRPLAAIQGLDERGRVIYVGTFSKVLFPALRLGFLVLPPALVAPFRATKWLTDRHSSGLEQAALADLIEAGDFGRHLRRMRARYARLRSALMAALAHHLGDRVEVVGSNAGIHLLAWLRDHPATSAETLRSRALEAGVGIYPITPYYLTPPSRLGLLFGYTRIPEDAIDEGIHRLSTVLDTL